MPPSRSVICVTCVDTRLNASTPSPRLVKIVTCDEIGALVSDCQFRNVFWNFKARHQRAAGTPQFVHSEINAAGRTSFRTSLVHPMMREPVRLDGNTSFELVRGWRASTSRMRSVSGISWTAPVLVCCASSTMRSALTSSQRKPDSSPRRIPVRSANRTKRPNEPRFRRPPTRS